MQLIKKNLSLIITLVITIIFVGIIIFSLTQAGSPDFRNNYFPILVIVLGIFPTILLTQIGEWNKIQYEKQKREEDRKFDLYKRREEIYNNLIESIRSFNNLTHNPEGQKLFLATYQKAWLYCPDKIVKKIEQFIDAINADSGLNAKQGIEAIQEIHLLIREDLISLEEIVETGLKWKEFRNVGINRKK